jgi:putative DNA primase/helicase
MIAQKLYDAGFIDLVSVTPPDAEISAQSRMDPSQLGKAPGKRWSDGKWAGYAFTKERIPAETIDSWGANIGLLGDWFPGLDIDVEDEGLSNAIVAQATKFFGAAPLRSSRGPRRLMVYQTDMPFPRMALKIHYKDQDHMVEVLGQGRQYVVSGKHPSGTTYGWLGDPLWTFKQADLPLINRDMVREFFTHLTEKLGDRAECTVIGDGSDKDELAVPQEELMAPSLNTLSALVKTIPNTNEHFPERDDYILMGHAIKAAADNDEVGLDIFAEWASAWEDGENDPEVVEADWSRMHPPYRVGWDWLQRTAASLTDYEPAQDIFEAGGEPLPPRDPRDPSFENIDFSDEWAVAQILSDVRKKLRYIPSTGEWYVWDEYKWVSRAGSLEHEIIIRGLLTRLALHLREQSKLHPEDEKLAKAMMASARRFQNEAGINAVIKLTRGRVSTPLSDFDTDPWVLNTPDGVVNLRTNEVAPSQKEDMHSRSTAVAPKGGPMPLFSKFMRDLTGDDPELIKFLQRYMGYCLTGDVSEKVLAFAWGSDSDTGKSTFIRTLSSIFGDYSDSVDAGAFITARTGGRIPDDIARLPGVRLVTATEPSARQAWDEKTIKAITGGDEISARKLFHSWFTFKPQFKILVVGNVQPEITNVDDAMLRRVMIVPMNHKVPPAEQIEDLSDRMIAEEGPAILQWLIDGCLAWGQQGMAPPEAVQHQTEKYKDTQDVLGQWISEQCELDSASVTTRRDLYTDWRIWCRGGSLDPGDDKSFKVNMDARAASLGIEDAFVGKKRRRGYKGIRLRDTMEALS